MIESWHTHTWVMSHTCISKVSHTHESCHTHKRAMSHTCMSHATHTVAADSEARSIKLSHITHMHESWNTHAWVMSHTCMRHVTHKNESYYTHECVILHTWAQRQGVLKIPTELWTHTHTIHPDTPRYMVTNSHRHWLRGKECSKYPKCFDVWVLKHAISLGTSRRHIGTVSLKTQKWIYILWTYIL